MKRGVDAGWMWARETARELGHRRESSACWASTVAWHIDHIRMCPGAICRAREPCKWENEFAQQPRVVRTPCCSVEPMVAQGCVVTHYIEQFEAWIRSQVRSSRPPTIQSELLWANQPWSSDTPGKDTAQSSPVLVLTPTSKIQVHQRFE